MVKEVHLPAGEELFAEGSRADSAYIIESGELEIIKDVAQPSGADGCASLWRRHRRDGAVEDSARSATVRARSDSVLYTIAAEQFDYLLKTSPTASRVLLGNRIGALASRETPCVKARRWPSLAR